jgi:putative two-component system response regulator
MQDDAFKRARVLIVDDQEANVRLLESILRRIMDDAGLRSTTDSRDVASLYGEFQPDLILLDLHMPHLDGFKVMEALGPLIPAGTYLPILVITADITPEVKQRALAGGAKDFLTKPFDPTEVLLRIKNLLETRFLHRELQNQNQLLEEKVRERTQDLEDTHIEVLERLARAAEYRDDETGQHAIRIGQTSALLARALGLPSAQALLIRRAAPLHDVGKIGIPDHILLKRGRLDPQELEVMKTHTTIGAKILSGGEFPLLQMAEEIALTHHERWDGTGYPQNLAGEAIPLAGRIVALTDAFDALTHARPYKKAWSVPETIAELKRCRGTQFDPRLVDAFLALTADPLASSVLRLPTSTQRS